MGQDVVSLFSGIGYHVKTSAQIRYAMTLKVASLKVKIEERRNRVKDIQEANKLTELQVAELETQYERDKKDRRERQIYATFSNAPTNYTDSGVRQEGYIPAGVVAQLVTEKTLLNSEREQIDDLELILRNLQDTERVACPQTAEWVVREAQHKLSQEALVYLKF